MRRGVVLAIYGTRRDAPFTATNQKSRRRASNQLLELQGRGFGNTFLRSLRENSAAARGHGLFRVFWPAAKVDDRASGAGRAVSHAELEAASGQFCAGQRVRAEFVAAAIIGIERCVSDAARAAVAGGVSAGVSECAQGRDHQAAGAAGIAGRSFRVE